MNRTQRTISAIIPVCAPVPRPEEIHVAYRDALAGLGEKVEFIWVIDGPYAGVVESLRRLSGQGEPITIVRFGRPFGEAAALAVGVEHARGEVILTLPPKPQVRPSDLPLLYEGLEENDLVVAVRTTANSASRKRLRQRLFTWCLNAVAESPVRDPWCGVRMGHRKVFEEVPLYGEAHRFLPVLAHRLGFRVREVTVHGATAGQEQVGEADRERDSAKFLDILTLFLLTRFTRKPLRFFGGLGLSLFVPGLLVAAYLVGAKLFRGEHLANRPLLLLSVLVIVVGVQIIALGLIAEIVIFTHYRDVKEYTVAEIINQG